MITPRFKVDQTEDMVLIDVFAKYVKANDVETYVDGHCFHFYVKPYFLKLHLPGNLVENGEETGTYDISEGVFQFKIPKETKGEYFQDLDMLTTLLTDPKKFKKPLIEELGEKVTDGDSDGDEEEICWDWKQELPQDDSLLGGFKYGFANQLSDVFTRFQDDLLEYIDIRSPEVTSYEERTIQRISSESEKFDVEHYLADFFEPDRINVLTEFQTPWQQEISNLRCQCKEDDNLKEKSFYELTKMKLTCEENEKLMKLPQKSYLLSKREEQKCFLGLVDILFAFCYNYRTTDGENTSESPWTICKLSATLSWFDSFEALRDVLICCYRRCLSYPLYRHWRLTEVVLEDVKQIVSLGKLWILRSLLEVHNIMQMDENRYIFNDLYVSDYIIWLQSVSSKKVLSLSNALMMEKMLEKEEVGYNLKKIEHVFADQELFTETESEGDEETESESDETDDEDEGLDSDDEPNPSS